MYFLDLKGHRCNLDIKTGRRQSVSNHRRRKSFFRAKGPSVSGVVKICENGTGWICYKNKKMGFEKLRGVTFLLFQVEKLQCKFRKEGQDKGRIS